MTHAMSMPHDEIANEGSQLSKLTAQDASSSCSCHVGTSNARAPFASFAHWKYRRAVEREQEPTFVIEGGRYFLGISTAVITAFVGMAAGAAPPIEICYPTVCWDAKLTTCMSFRPRISVHRFEIVTLSGLGLKTVASTTTRSLAV